MSEAGHAAGHVRWWWRALGALALYAVLEVTLTVVDYAPDPLRLALLVGVGVAAAGLARDSLAVTGPATWSAQPSHSVLPTGSDARLAGYVRMVEDHLTAPTPSGVLRDRLVDLSDGELADELEGPPRRLGKAQIDDYLRRIEER
ncbi:hypothetical protein ACT8ZV_06385 [Nocardioides sp. MAHUQ-72]|uniref:hypothetical protein n=1 Tax=unclassified Nocardioides TaxID=2615069 RepID=UPI003606538E